MANHVSWLDVYAINCLLRARFVAKQEVGGWPFIGRMVAAFGALFIVRGSPRDAARVKTRIAAALRGGERVVVFPEGTTTDGTTLGRFYPALFQAAIEADAMIQPVAIRYTDANGRPTTAAAFIDDMTFMQSLHRITAAPAITAELMFGPPRSPQGHPRRALAAEHRAWIAQTLGIHLHSAQDVVPKRRFDRAA